jgi:hypothetical protein
MQTTLNLPDGLVAQARAYAASSRKQKNVMIFGQEAGFSQFLGAYLVVFSVPDYLHLDGDTILYRGPGRTAGIYSTPHQDEARVFFAFRSSELHYSRRDIPRQKQLLAEAYAGMGWEMPRLMAELNHTSAFYFFDSITQIQMTTWSRGRVSLVGDAAYCPASRSVAAPAWPSSAPTFSPMSWPQQAGTMSAVSVPTNTSWATMHDVAASSRSASPNGSSRRAARSYG